MWRAIFCGLMWLSARAACAAAQPAALTAELLQRVERVLTQHIGPIARVVPRKTAQAPTAEALFERVAAQVDAGAERERLLADLRRML